MSKIRIQVIGNYLRPLEKTLQKNGIIVENFIDSCNHLAIVGEQDHSMDKYCKDTNQQSLLLAVRKNLDRMLSRDEDNFCPNIKEQPKEKAVRTKNNTEYIVLMLNLAGYHIFKRNDKIFSDIYPNNNDYTKDLRTKEYMEYKIPYPEDFNWKFYFDKFIDIILNEYQSDHIILIRMHAAQWYMEKNQITPFTRESVDFRRFLEEMDDYFWERTQCICIDDCYKYIRDSDINCANRYARVTPYILKCLDRSLKEVILSPKEAQINFVSYHNPMVRKLEKNMTSDWLDSNKGLLDFMESKWITSVRQLELNGKKGNIVFEKFLDKDRGYNLADYVLELSDLCLENIDESSIAIIESYTENFKLNINDVVAVFYLYENSNNKSAFKQIVKNICENRDCLPVTTSAELCKKNIDYLKQYKYISGNIELTMGDSVYVRLENNNWIEMNPNLDLPMKQVYFNFVPQADYRKIIENGYRCSIWEAESICSSWGFYLEKAKRGDGNKIIEIAFKTKCEFQTTLQIIDYAELLNAEQFFLTLADDRCEIFDFKSSTNLDFLFADNVKIVQLRNGFADQIIHYVFGKRLEKTSGTQIYYDDIDLQFHHKMNGLEVTNVTRDNIENRLLSNLLPPKLVDSYDGTMEIADLLYSNGLKHLVAVYTPNVYNKIEKCSKLIFKQEDYRDLFLYQFRAAYYGCFVRPEILMGIDAFNLGEYISFPAYDKDENIAIEKMMLASDAIALHIRLGDFVTFGRNVDNAFYRETVSKVLDIDVYQNKSIFVFSDDILWCKEHRTELGLDLTDKVIYVDHNKGDDSFWDMKLISLGKVIIGSLSGFSRIAALLSDRCELYLSSDQTTMRRFEKIGFGNKKIMDAYASAVAVDTSTKVQNKENLPDKKDDRTNVPGGAESITARL